MIIACRGAVIKAVSHLIARFIKVFMWLCGRPIISVLWPGSSLVTEVSMGLHSNLNTVITTGHQTQC